MSNGREEWRPQSNPWLIAIAVMLATFMEVLDTSVANVAVPHIAGSLSVTSDEATWVLTSYLIANAIILPATNWLGNVFGRKCFLIVCIMIFTAASALCGAAFNLGFLIIARVLQGAGGGALQPVSQAILLESFPPEKRGAAMATFAMGVVVAPILGPLVGGWITDHYTWRWIFYINLPIGIGAVLMVHTFVQDPPYLNRVPLSSIDIAGFALMSIWLASLQYVLDKGQEEDWFSSPMIKWLCILSTLGLIGFLIREFTAKAPLVDLCVFKNRNFAIGVALITLLGGVLYGTTAALPLFMQTLMGYTAFSAGMALSPRGLGAFLTTIVVGRIAGRFVSNRVLIAIGFIVLAVASFQLGNIELGIPMSFVVWMSLLNGVAISLIFVPLTTSTMGTLAQEEIGNASGIYNLLRNLGGSFGISGFTTLVARLSQKHNVYLAAHASPLNPQYAQTLSEIESKLADKVGPVLAHRQAQAIIGQTVIQQSTVLAYADVFRLIAILCIVCIPIIVFLKRTKGKAGRAMAH